MSKQFDEITNLINDWIKMIEIKSFLNIPADTLIEITKNPDPEVQETIAHIKMTIDVEKLNNLFNDNPNILELCSKLIDAIYTLSIHLWEQYHDGLKALDVFDFAMTIPMNSAKRDQMHSKKYELKTQVNNIHNLADATIRNLNELWKHINRAHSTGAFIDQIVNTLTNTINNIMMLKRATAKQRGDIIILYTSIAQYANLGDTIKDLIVILDWKKDATIYYQKSNSGCFGMLALSTILVLSLFIVF